MSEPLVRPTRDHGHDTTQNGRAFKPRVLKQCVRAALERPIIVEGTNQTKTCAESELKRIPATFQERQLLREELVLELEEFKGCICDSPKPARHCNFNLRHVVRNETALEICFPRDEYHPGKLHHEEPYSDFVCELKRSRRITCRHSHINLTPQQTRFQGVLDCVTNVLRDFKCPVTTTAIPLLTTTATGPTPTKILILVMALVISLMVGVLCTWLGIFCWRKKRRRRRKERDTYRQLSMMTKPEHGSQPNLYDGHYTEDHIYDIVHGDGTPKTFPDLLSRAPSLPPMRAPSTPRHHENSAMNKSMHGENYEPLLRSSTKRIDRDETNLKSPVNEDDRTSLDYLPLLAEESRNKDSNTTPKRFHPYDSADDSLATGIEACDDSQTTPKIVQEESDSPKRPKNDYFVLESRLSGDIKPREVTLIKNEKKSVENENDLTSDNKRDSQKSDGYVITTYPGELAENLLRDKVSVSDVSDTVSRDSDGYEIPVTTFDIASSFRKSAGAESEKDDILNV